MAQYTTTDRVGVNAVERIVVKDLGWIFREQPIVDMGIDAHVEKVEKGNPSGKLLALQIKTGASHFIDKGDHLVFYGKLRHLNYWTGHSLPVLLIAHLPESDETFWALVSESSAKRTAKRWKIEISKKSAFGKKTQQKLIAAFEGSPAQLRSRKLTIDEPLMRHIADGGKVSLELEDWVNKSLGRTPVKVYIQDENGNEILSQDWFQFYTGYSMPELAEALFPWATVEMDEDFYEENAAEESETGQMLGMLFGVSAISPKSAHVTQDIRPYREAFGEVEYYRLQLLLNPLGHSFLMVSDHLSKDE